jgi:hypothetical protein
MVPEDFRCPICCMKVRPPPSASMHGSIMAAPMYAHASIMDPAVGPAAALCLPAAPRSAAWLWLAWGLEGGSCRPAWGPAS